MLAKRYYLRKGLLNMLIAACHIELRYQTGRIQKGFRFIDCSV